MQVDQNRISQSVKSNLKIITQILRNNKRLHLSESVSSVTSNEANQLQIQLRKYFPLIKSLLMNINNPFKVLGIYSKLMMSRYPKNIISDPLFENTLFSPKIHSILTHYLQEQTQYYKMNENAEKIVDVFYKFMFYENSHLMENNLQNSAVSNMGRWFFEEGLEKMFHKYFFTAQDFTIMMTNFMLHGIGALFIAAVSILGKLNFEQEMQNIQNVHIGYIKKYGLM